jgi:hypothetical protein
MWHVDEMLKKAQAGEGGRVCVVGGEVIVANNERVMKEMMKPGIRCISKR